MDIAEYLYSKDIQVKQGGNGNIYTHCWHCNEDESKRGRLYINVDPESDSYGAMFCHRCHATGGINAIRKHFGDAPLSSDLTPVHTQIFNEATRYYTQRLYENPSAYKYLQEKRGLTDETIRDLQFGWADGGLLTHLVAAGYKLDDIKSSCLINHFGSDFLEDKITIPYFSYGNTVTIRGKTIGGKYLSLPSPYGTARLYGVDAIRGEQTVLVSAGELDCAVLQQMGYAAIGVPGENIWKPEWTEELSGAKRVFILFDNDNAGKAGAEKLATKLGPISRVVEMPEARPGQKKIDVSEWYVNHNKTREDFDYLLSKATGGLLVSPTQAYDRWTEIEGNPDLVGLRFNVNGIDKEMQHGLLPGQVVVVISKSNAGKTLATLNIFHRMKMARPDIKILYISLEQTRNEWFERAHRINNFYNPNSTTLDTVKFWQDTLYLVDKNRLTEEELEVCLDQYEFETGGLPDIVAVDYLGYYSRSFPGEEYARVTSAIMGLKGIAKTRQIVIFAPHQVNRTGDYGKAIQADQGKSSGAIEETADMLISLWNPDQQLDIRKEEQKKEINMQILKSRDGGVGTMIQYQFAPLTLAIVPKDDPDYFERALRERQYWLAGVDWEKAVYMHATGDERLTIDE